MSLSGKGGLGGAGRDHASVIDVGIAVRGANMGVMRASMSVMGVDIGVKSVCRGVIGVGIAVRSPSKSVKVLANV